MDILNGQFIDFMMTQLEIDLLPQTINAKMRIAVTNPIGAETEFSGKNSVSSEQLHD